MKPGHHLTTKLVDVVNVPAGVATVIGPVRAVLGIVTVICCPEECTVKTASDPLICKVRGLMHLGSMLGMVGDIGAVGRGGRVGFLKKRTDVVPVKPDPVMTTWVPTGPLEGVKLVIVGGGITPLN